ncbi:succinate dehydrogenase hydrophobic membrane anchor subunit [soil metagenome]
MPKNYGRTARSSAFQWFLHRITGTFLIFLLITHFWVQHYDRTTASISHSVVTAEQAAEGVLPEYREEANEAVQRMRSRRGAERPVETERVVPAQEGGTTAAATPYDVLMLRLGDPVYAVLWKGFNLLFLALALHHGFYGINNILTDYIRNDMARVTATTLSWALALVLLIVGSYSVIVAGLNV